MVSTFAWLASDPEQRRRMMEAAELFRDKGTIDDLGIGIIRDSFSDTLFPGTSTLHTRVRYMLFVPWLMQIAASEDTANDMVATFHDLERSFIGTLKKGMGDDAEGIIGRRAGKLLQRPPSVIYWGGMASWGIVEHGLSVQDYFRRLVLRKEQEAAASRVEETDAFVDLISSGMDAALPAPPRELESSATFDLRHEDAIYLAELITRTHPRSLMAHLLENRPAGWTDTDTAPAFAWAPEIKLGLPGDLKRTVDLAERFSMIIQGANLLYNLLLAEEVEADGENGEPGEKTTLYDGKLAEWSTEVRKVAPLRMADLQEIADMMARLGRTATRPTRLFLERWCELAASPDSVRDSTVARDLVRRRELAIKGGRARLRPGNRKALDAWGGASGVQQLEFRWSYGRSHLQDIFDGLEAA